VMLESEFASMIGSMVYIILCWICLLPVLGIGLLMGCCRGVSKALHSRQAHYNVQSCCLPEVIDLRVVSEMRSLGC